jgi:plastocyanin
VRAILLALAMVAVSLAGCANEDDGVREIEIHIGYSADRKSQYLTPKEIHVKAGEKVRLVVTNDDKPGAADAFHDVAFRIPGYDELFEHEVPAGQTTKTCRFDAGPTTACAKDKSYFVVETKGTYKLWCEVGPQGQNPDGSPKTRHEQMGMWGTLVVA